MKLRKTKRLVNFLAEHERIFNVLSTTITAIFTVVLATSTVFLWKETKDLRNFAQEQSADMKHSIDEAARAATAMEGVAVAVAASAKAADESLETYKDANVRQMRAYLTVGFGGVIKQDPGTGYRFEVRMNLQNVGNTPAYGVVSNVHVDVFPFPLPEEFQFPQLDDAISGASAVGPHQSFFLTGVADRIYSEGDVDEVSSGLHKRLYIYGTVKYEDAFGTRRQTRFCQAIIWLKNDTFMGLNTSKYNDAN